jgi:CDP-diacylglycerol--glycerol-3-phosphate 3-phosphatidyltransferase
MVSMVRVLLAPVLIALALMQHPFLFIAVVLFSGFTDVVDGYLARRLNQVTALGSHLDTWGDFLIFTSMAVGAWLLWPEIVIQEQLAFTVILASFTLPALVGLLKFRTLTSYHTWSVKLAVLLTFAGYTLLFGGLLDWPFRVAAVASAYAGIEEIAITLLLNHARHDIRSLRKALIYHRKETKQSA